MAQYTRNAETIEAVQWSKIGDCSDVTSLDAKDAKAVCTTCGQLMSAHGSQQVSDDLSNIVCPGKWIITREDGRIEYLDDATFQKRYTVVPEVIKP